jgi:phage N-6-adenine methyltransferase
VNRVLFSSKETVWSTPQDFFNKLNEEFDFTIDVCALPENAKCKRYFTPEDDALKQKWTGTCFCNPPYGREIGQWVEKASKSADEGATVVMLLPARTDTKWFHNYVYGKAEIRFVAGRLKFGGSKNSATFPSMVVIFRSELVKEQL